MPVLYKLYKNLISTSKNYGQSYARDIAEKYGITYDDITKNYDNRKEAK